MTHPPAIARPLRIVWLAVCASGALAMGALTTLAAMATGPPMPERAEGAFYIVALVSVAALVGAFALVRRMEARLAQSDSDAHAERVLMGYGVAALAAAEVPTLAGALAAFLTGDLLTLALGMPLFAFAWLTWPSDGRVGYWLALRRHA